MATFDSLPLESLSRILELAGEHDIFDADQHNSALETLAAASLVARRWTEPAQAAMWHYLRISHKGKATRIAASPGCGKYRSARVQMRGRCLSEDETIAGALEKLRGIQWLQLAIWGSKLYEVDLLGLASLQDLKTLIIDIDAADGSVVPQTLQPTFRLRNLTLGEFATSPTLIRTLLASSSSSLISLTLEDVLPHYIPTIFASLSLVAPSLVSLSLHLPIPGLGPILSSFTALTSLTLYIPADLYLPRYDSFLAALTRPIKVIKVVPEDLEYPFVRDLTKCLHGKAWRKVTEVGFGASETELEAVLGGKGLLELCEERGIGVVYE